MERWPGRIDLVHVKAADRFLEHLAGVQHDCREERDLPGEQAQAPPRSCPTGSRAEAPTSSAVCMVPLLDGLRKSLP